MGRFEEYDQLLVDARDDGVIVATLNRPERLNAFDGRLRRDIYRLLDEVTTDDGAKVLVMTGAGRGFCSGADLAAEDRRGWPTGPAEPLFAWCTRLLEMPKPTIAAINGVAAGGGLGLALLFDIRICSTDARLLPIWLKRAIHPDDLITWTLPRLVGYSRALEWLYLADDIPLDAALESGMISRVVEPADLLPAALDLAERLAAGPTAHFALTKKAVLGGLSATPTEAAMMEAWGQDRAFASDDFKEGVLAFREKRSPRFTGR
jgi:2-(1,2-epoxy-1,2-dihydrophenyl)acetyl-CoA isomerase